ncbi:MAG: carboxypeptidase-like regulatory domain-containing protein [Flavobacteriaceae bacterium]|nr:carboxypeptidase-like regulatory domain-containing protein [Flavobacteriaceae bacterium]
MKKNYFILIILCFTVSFAFSQDIDRIEVFGRIVVDSVDVEGVTVYNTSSNKGAITDIDGKFSIEVALNDRLEISALQFEKFVVVINEDIISNKIMTVFLVERINKLDEVVILPYGLSGNLTVDIESVKTFNPDLDAIYFGIQNMDDFEFSDDYKSGVVNMAMEEGRYYNGADFVQIIGLLVKPIFKSNKKDIINNSDAYKDLTTKYSLSYLQKNLNIPEDSIDEFIHFVEDNGFDKNLMEEGNELQFLEFLISQSKAFKKSKSGKN